MLVISNNAVRDLSRAFVDAVDSVRTIPGKRPLDNDIVNSAGVRADVVHAAVLSMLAFVTRGTVVVEGDSAVDVLVTYFEY